MFYERRIDSLSDLIREAGSLDADGGLRVLGRYGGRNCYLFVARFGKRYTVMIYERKGGRQDGLGRRLAVEELEGPGELRRLLKKVVPGRVRAFAY